MKVITWNINKASGRRLQRQIQWLHTQESDILLLQEVRDAEALLHALHGFYGHIKFTTPPSDKLPSTLIASKYPLQPCDQIKNLPQPFRVLSCLSDTPIGQLSLHSVHTPPAANYKAEKVLTIDAVTAHVRSDPTGCHVIAGDFNSPRYIYPKFITWGQRFDKRKSEWVLRRTRHGISGERWDAIERDIHSPLPNYVNSFSELHPDSEAVSYKSRRYDHLILPKQILPRSAEYGSDALENGLSDHAPFIAEW